MTKDELPDACTSLPIVLPPQLHVTAGDKSAPAASIESSSAKTLRPLSERPVAEQIDACLRDLVDSGAIDLEDLVRRAREEQRVEQRNTWIKRGAVSAMMIGSLAVGVVLVQKRTETYVATDEPRVFNLKEGTEVELNAHSEIKVRFSSASRDLYLTQGEGMFKVRPDRSRPFRVHTDHAIFQAVGTQFDVWVTHDHSGVAVAQGTVQPLPVSSSAPVDAAGTNLPQVTAGFSLTVDAAGRPGALEPVDIAEVAAWRQSLSLEATDKTLAEIADAFNQRNKKPKLIIEGDTLRARRFTLSLDAADFDALMKYLEGVDGVMVIRTKDEVIVREQSQ